MNREEMIETLSSTSTFERDELDAMTDNELEELYHSLETEDWISELERESPGDENWIGGPYHSREEEEGDYYEESYTFEDFTHSDMEDVKELLEMVGMKGTQEDMIFLTKAIMENEVKEQLNYCSYDIVPTQHSIKLYVYIAKPLPEDEGVWSRDQWLRQEAEDLIRHRLYVLGLSGELIRGHSINVSNTGDC